MRSLIAVAGCPNSGKTSLFNQLAGAKQTVGNWPGQTVDRYSAMIDVGELEFELVDLPGTYGLVAVSAEEAIAADFLIDERPDVVITVVDACNLSGSLHLAAQVAEAGMRQVIALNMVDVADRRGIHIAERQLEEQLGVEVVRTVARRGEGTGRVKAAVARALTKPGRQLVIDYGPALEGHVAKIAAAVGADSELAAIADPRWMALQLLAGDAAMRSRVAATTHGHEVLEATAADRDAIAAEAGFGAAIELAERRFKWITRLAAEMAGSSDVGPTWSDRIDRVLTHRRLGIPVFLAAMWVVLRVTADVTAPYLDWVDATVSGPVARWAAGLLDLVGLGGGWLESLVVDGVLAGVGGVLVFVPVLFGLYLMLALLEDSGYMARAAAVMDRAMRSVGIPGKAFLPMMVGFGCTVPAIYATRTLESDRDRLLTGLITPFMSCGARLPVYVLLATIFFADHKAAAIFAMYVLGIAVAVVIGLLLSRTVLREEEPAPFVMVLPEFRLPNVRTVWILVRQRTGSFIKGAGTTILVASIAVWFLLALPLSGGRFADTEVEDSAFGVVSKGIAPVLEPLGIGDWEQSGSLLSGFVAKEVVVSTMAQLYVTEVETTPDATNSFVADLAEIGTTFLEAGADTVRALPRVIGIDFLGFSDTSDSRLHAAVSASFDESSNGHGRPAALGFMVFVLLYTPCMAAVGAFRHEFGTRWMWVSVIGQFAIAWLGAFLAYQGGRLVGLG